jgi:hypothetical protein
MASAPRFVSVSGYVRTNWHWAPLPARNPRSRIHAGVRDIKVEHGRPIQRRDRKGAFAARLSWKLVRLEDARGVTLLGRLDKRRRPNMQ